MHRLIAPVREDERGVVAVIVTVALVVLLGMAAFVIDVGAIYQERRELQNGSDAGALAIAEDCAKGSCGPYMATAQGLADPNAEDGATVVDDVAIDMAAQTVTVDTSTADASGGSVVAFKFAQVLGFSGDTVHASATAQWSPPAKAPALPLVVSKCEWDKHVGAPENLPSGNLTLSFHSGNNTESCNGPAGQDVPGGFGWLDATNCETEMTVENGGLWVESKTGNTPTGTGCTPAHVAVGSTVLVPIFDNTKGQGTNATFHLVGFAAFEVAGIALHNSGGWTDGAACQLTAPTPPEEEKGNNGKGKGKGGSGGSSGNDTQCMTGRFVEYFVADAAAGGPSIPDLGVTTVSLIK